MINKYPDWSKAPDWAQIAVFTDDGNGLWSDELRGYCFGHFLLGIRSESITDVMDVNPKVHIQQRDGKMLTGNHLPNPWF